MALAKTQTDAHGKFAIDLSDISVTVPTTYWNGRYHDETRMARERPDPRSLYLIATGGNAGGGTNPAIKLMLGLGNATGLRGVTINEITTVVTTFIYARVITERNGLLFLNDTSTARALVDPERGTLRSMFSERANTPALVNTLADVVAACVRSAGQKSPPCQALFAAAPPVDRPRASYMQTSAPVDTFAALRNIALWPQRNARRVFSLLPPQPPYMPVLTSAPREFMISLNLALGGLKHPSGIAFDPDSNAMWIANEGGNSVTELGAGPNNFGKPLSGPGGLTGGGLSAPTAIRFVAISPPDTGSGPPPTPSLWVANRSGDSLTEIILSPPGHPTLRRITGNGLKAPVDLVEIDGERYTNVGVQTYQFIAVANSGAGVVILFKTLDGLPCGDPVRIDGLRRAAGIGFADPVILIADPASNVLFEIKKPDAACRGAEVLGKTASLGLSAPRFITWGRYPGDAAVTNAMGNSIAVFTHKSTGDPRTPSMALDVYGSPFTGGGLKGPAGIAIDGDANAWVANNAPGANSVSEIARVEMLNKTPGTRLPLSPQGSFTGAGLDRPFGIAIDNSGNVWVTNQGNNSVTVFIGAAHASY